jgi:hypothetical protein
MSYMTPELFGGRFSDYLRACSERRLLVFGKPERRTSLSSGRRIRGRAAG